MFAMSDAQDELIEKSRNILSESELYNRDQLIEVIEEHNYHQSYKDMIISGIKEIYV